MTVRRTGGRGIETVTLVETIVLPTVGPLLLYHVAGTPAPLAAGETGGLTLLATNTSADNAVELTSVTLTIDVGANASQMTAAFTDVGYSIYTSGQTTANFCEVTPPSDSSTGTATWTIIPQLGISITVPAQGSIVLTLYGIAVNTIPGSTKVSVVETPASSVVTSTVDFFLPKVMPAPYVRDLTANLAATNPLQPIAQPTAGSNVTLTWATSATNVSDISILQSSQSGQQTFTPTSLTTWTTSEPPTCDTVFTVSLYASNYESTPRNFAQSVAVGVVDPEVVVDSLSILGTASLFGNPSPQSWEINFTGGQPVSTSFTFQSDGFLIGVLYAATLGAPTLTMQQGEGPTLQLLGDFAGGGLTGTNSLMMPVSQSTYATVTLSGATNGSALGVIYYIPFGPQGTATNTATSRKPAPSPKSGRRRSPRR